MVRHKCVTVDIEVQGWEKKCNGRVVKCVMRATVRSATEGGHKVLNGLKVYM